MTATKASPAAFAKALESWFLQSARDLPWRKTRDPYAIWVSEIMLQQTRVATVIEKYIAFMARFPTNEDLANAELDAVRAQWSGLGYYRRCENLWRGAQFVRDEFGGSLPRSVDELRRIPGIGRYTASAIASIAFEVPSAAIDGNVLRIGSRIGAWDDAVDSKALDKLVRPWADAVVEQGTPSILVQALMELGATVCTPKIANCAICPVRTFCASKDLEDPTIRPTSGKKIRPAKWGGLFVVPVMRDGTVLLKKRPERGLLSGMLLPFGHMGPEADADTKRYLNQRLGAFLKPLGLKESAVSHDASVSWRFTHIMLRARVLRVDVDAAPKHDGFVPMARGTVQSHGLANLTRAMLKAIEAL